MFAPATSNNGGSFINWTSSETNFFDEPLDPRQICVSGFGTGTKTYTANYTAPNVAPTIAANNASVTVNEGQTASNTSTYSDPNTGQNVAFTASVGTVTKTGTNSGAWSWSYATTDGPDQSQTVTITANDGNGGTASTTFSLTVHNVAPTVTLSGPTTASESATAEHTYTYTISDPGVDTFSFAAGYPTCGSGGTLVGAPAIGDGSFKCKFLDGPATPTVAIRVQDSDSALSNVATVAVTVNNVAPDGGPDWGRKRH